MRLPFSKVIPTGEKKDPVVALTPLGEQKIESFSGGGPGVQLLSILCEEGPSTVGALARRMKVDYNKAKVIANALIRQGLIRRTDSND